MCYAVLALVACCPAYNELWQLLCYVYCSWHNACMHAWCIYVCVHKYNSLLLTYTFFLSAHPRRFPALLLFPISLRLIGSFACRMLHWKTPYLLTLTGPGPQCRRMNPQAGHYYLDFFHFGFYCSCHIVAKYVGKVYNTVEKCVHINKAMGKFQAWP
jgi:hypothetical protein